MGLLRCCAVLNEHGSMLPACLEEAGAVWAAGVEAGKASGVGPGSGGTAAPGDVVAHVWLTKSCVARADAHGEVKVNAWEAPTEVAKWKEERECPCALFWVCRHR